MRWSGNVVLRVERSVLQPVSHQPCPANTRGHDQIIGRASGTNGSDKLVHAGCLPREFDIAAATVDVITHLTAVEKALPGSCGVTVVVGVWLVVQIEYD